MRAAALVVLVAITFALDGCRGRAPHRAPTTSHVVAGATVPAVQRQLRSTHAATRAAGVRGAATLLGVPIVDDAGRPVRPRGKRGAAAPVGTVLYESEVPQLARMASLPLGSAGTLAGLLGAWGLRGRTDVVTRELAVGSAGCTHAGGRSCAADLIGATDRFTLLDAWLYVLDVRQLTHVPGTDISIRPSSPLADGASPAAHALVLANLPQIRIQASGRTIRQGVAGGASTRTISVTVSMPADMPGFTGGPLAGTQVRTGPLDGAIVRWAIDGTTWGSTLRGVDAPDRAGAGTVDGATTETGRAQVEFDAGATGGVPRGAAAAVSVSLTVLASGLASVAFDRVAPSIEAAMLDAPSPTETVALHVCCPAPAAVPAGPQ